MIVVSSVTAPAAWASCLVNGDEDDLSPQDLAGIDALLLAIKPARIVDAEGEPRFTRHFLLYGGDAPSGEVLDYTTHLALR